MNKKKKFAPRERGNQTEDKLVACAIETQIE